MALRKNVKKALLVIMATMALVVCFVVSTARADYSKFYPGFCTWHAAQQFDSVSPTSHCNWSGNAKDWLTKPVPSF